MSSEINPEDPSPDASKIGRWMFIALFWLGVLGVAGWFAWENEQKRHETRIPLVSQDGSIKIMASRNNHFIVEGLVNGHPVVFLVDTGATDVSIPRSIAEAIGLEGGRWVPVSTANGTINVQTTRIDSLKIGSLALESVDATINPQDEDSIALLGMSFLRYFDLIQRDGMLEIRTP